jgi:hypothetical protein
MPGDDGAAETARVPSPTFSCIVNHDATMPRNIGIEKILADINSQRTSGTICDEDHGENWLDR